MKLFISGREGFAKAKLSPAALRAKNILDKSKDGELFTTGHLTALVGVTITVVQSGNMKQLLPGYSHKVKGSRYWGKPATIKQLIKETR